MVEIRVEVLAFGHVEPFRRLVMITGQNVVNVVDSSRSESDFGEIRGPYASICVLGLLLGVVGGVNAVVDESVTVLPLLVVVLFEVVVGRVDAEQAYNACKFQLGVSLVKNQVVFLVNHTVAISAVFSEDLESSSQRPRVISA